MKLGEYPPEFNPNVHGSYDPARYYGKPDTPFGELKLSEVPAWIGRRNKTPLSTVQLFGRAYWRWRHKYFFAKRATPSGYYQIIATSCLVLYWANSERLSEHQRAKYH